MQVVTGMTEGVATGLLGETAGVLAGGAGGTMLLLLATPPLGMTALEVGTAGAPEGLLLLAAPAPAGVVGLLAGQSVTVGPQEVMVTSSVW